MSDHKHLVYAILHFLNEQKESGTLKEDAVESLEVASQCLETAYEVSLQDDQAAALYVLPAPLSDVFSRGLAHYGQEVAVAAATAATAAVGVTPTFIEVSASDKEQAENHKAEGNEFMKQDKFAEALDCYTKAINIDSSNAVYYCNRAAAHSKLNNNSEAMADCKTALDIDPNYSKAYGRKGLAHSALNEHKEAIECYKRALELDPDNPSYKQNLEIAEKKAGPGGMPGMPGVPGMPGGMGGLNLGGLDFSSMMSNPALMNMATNMMQNPQMQQLMANLMSGAGGPGTEPGGPAGMANLLQAGQQLAQQMQQTNPDLVEQLREQMGPATAANPADEPDDSEPPK